MSERVCLSVFVCVCPLMDWQRVQGVFFDFVIYVLEALPRHWYKDSKIMDE